MEYKYEVLELKVGKLELRLYQVTNIDEVFDELISRSESDPDKADERIPYWTELWPSAIAMSQYLVDNPELVTHKNVLEIGCGLGLPSLVSAKLGASRVIASDYLPDSLDFVQKNAQLNGLHQRVLLARQVDWRMLDEDPDFKNYDLILAADILYEQRYVDAFHLLLQSLRSGQRLVIAEPGREVAASFITALVSGSDFTTSIEKVKVDFRGTEFEVTVVVVFCN